MLQPGDDNCVSTGTKREDRQAQSKNRFDSLQIDVKCPDTAVILLGSRERPVLVAAAAALTKFAAKGKDHLQTLFELDVVDSLMPLIEHEDLCTRRFAMRLLAEMAAMTIVRNHILGLPSSLNDFTNTLTKDPDPFIQEYASLILAEISKEPFGAIQLLERCSTLDFLFDKIKQSDPDIKKNNIEIMNNLLKDPIGAAQLIASQAFNFLPIYQLLNEPYPAIQTLALSVVESLVARKKDDKIQKLFQESGGLRVLLDLLEKVEFANLHSQVLRILLYTLDNKKTMEILNLDGGVEKLFKYLEYSTNPSESREVLDVLVRLGNTQSGRKTLHNFDIVTTLLKNLRLSRDPEVSRIACYGLGIMSRYKPACEEIMKDNPTKLIFDVVKDESTNKWPARKAAIFALRELCISDEKNCHIFLELNGHAYLEWLLKQPFGKIPLEIVVAAVDILSIIVGYPELRQRLIQVELIDALCTPFEAKDRTVDELKIACCKALSAIFVEKQTRELSHTKNFVKRLFVLLQSYESIPVRATAVKLVQQLCGDYSMAEQFVQSGYLNYLLKNRAVANVVPSWETCIKALFSAHLPVKFAVTGRLSLHDITQDGFYVMRRHICPFPMLDELFRFKMCPVEPIYIVNFAEPRSSFTSDRLFSSSEEKTPSEVSSRNYDVKFGKIQSDPYLNEYLELFKCILAANETDELKETSSTVVNISKIALRAKLLGIFVARQLSGPDPKNPCIDHQLDIHVQEIREDLKTSVIPLGQLRIGSYLERALLFKVIADKICLPSALVRGKYGKAWIEIAIPEINNPVERAFTSSLPDVLIPKQIANKKSTLRINEKSETLINKPNISLSIQREETNKIRVIIDNLNTVLPTRLLCENYVVDLLEKPGDLIPIESARAKAYCNM